MARTPGFNNEGNTKKSKMELHRWRMNFQAFVKEKKRLKKECQRIFKKETTRVYKEAREETEARWKRNISPLLQTADPDDTRKNSKLNKALKRLYPDKNYTEYTKEEAERLRDWENGLTTEEFKEYQKNKDYVEQIAQLQYHPVKEIPHQKIIV